jgi:hypothetical protein
MKYNYHIFIVRTVKDWDKILIHVIVSLSWGKGLPIYPRNPIAAYVWARGQTYPVQTDLAVSEKLENH